MANQGPWGRGAAKPKFVPGHQGAVVPFGMPQLNHRACDDPWTALDLLARFGVLAFPLSHGQAPALTATQEINVASMIATPRICQDLSCSSKMVSRTCLHSDLARRPHPISRQQHPPTP